MNNVTMMLLINTVTAIVFLVLGHFITAKSHSTPTVFRRKQPKKGVLPPKKEKRDPKVPKFLEQ